MLNPLINNLPNFDITLRVGCHLVYEAIGFPDLTGHMDFHAYAEVYLGGRWYTTDPRFHTPRIGRVKVSCGLDAVDGAFSTIYGGANLSYFEIWAYQIARGSVNVGDPIDLSRRLDNQWIVQTDNS